MNKKNIISDQERQHATKIILGIREDGGDIRSNGAGLVLSKVKDKKKENYVKFYKPLLLSFLNHSDYLYSNCIERLRKQPSLVKQHQSVMEGKESAEKLLQNIDTWDMLDRELRIHEKHNGKCPLLGGCDDDSPVICRSCARQA